jgi:hypothetical protein
MLMAASFPIQPSIRGRYSIPHPYFTFVLPGTNNSQRIVQWQVHPKEDSLRRYTLVEIGAASERPDVALSENSAREPKILAIYHHIGINVWMPKDFSEGVLLLPDQTGSEDNEREVLIVASLLALLWQLREQAQMKPRKLKRAHSRNSQNMWQKAISVLHRH